MHFPFQRRFTMVPGARENDGAILHFVFGVERPKRLEALPQHTTLERAVVCHLQNGRHCRHSHRLAGSQDLS